MPLLYATFHRFNTMIDASFSGVHMARPTTCHDGREDEVGHGKREVFELVVVSTGRTRLSPIITPICSCYSTPV
jgi:hypothetical protein